MIVFNKKFVIGILFIMGLCILAFISFAQTLNTDDISSDEINNSLNNIMKNEFGSIKIKNEKTSDNRAVLEDNKYIYNVDKASGKIIHFLIKDYTKNSNIVDNISKEEVIELASERINKINGAKDRCKFNLTQYKYIYNENKKLHNLVFEEVADNGIKTGEAILIDFNNKGELVGMAIHHGNADIALNSKASLSKQDTINFWC